MDVTQATTSFLMQSFVTTERDGYRLTGYVSCDVLVQAAQ
jgi:hypothetical protein